MTVHHAYINGLGCISPQPSMEPAAFLEEPVCSVSNRLKTIDPNYRDFIPPEMVRRMSRIIRMGVAAAKTALADAGGVVPERIITGTGLGCIEDTEKFLGNMIKNREEFLTPTSFIQSTHNTVSAQIALLLGCHGYNFTYVHRGFSLETALLDSLVQIRSGFRAPILAGCADELTNHSFEIQQRMGFWRQQPVDNLKLFTRPGKGTIAGEGASFVVLSPEKTDRSYARLTDTSMLLNPSDVQEVDGWIRQFLNQNKLSPEAISYLLLGRNGDSLTDRWYESPLLPEFNEAPYGYFKHLCGEYMTSTGFSLWLGARILREQMIPSALMGNPTTGGIQNILIYNHYRGINHTLILVRKA